jgi:hypothetical protein
VTKFCTLLKSVSTKFVKQMTGNQHQSYEAKPSQENLK